MSVSINIRLESIVYGALSQARLSAVLELGLYSHPVKPDQDMSARAANIAAKSVRPVRAQMSLAP